MPTTVRTTVLNSPAFIKGHKKKISVMLHLNCLPWQHSSEVIWLSACHYEDCRSKLLVEEFSVLSKLFLAFSYPPLSLLAYCTVTVEFFLFISFPSSLDKRELKFVASSFLRLPLPFFLQPKKGNNFFFSLFSLQKFKLKESRKENGIYQISPSISCSRSWKLKKWN